ncbi:MAG: hypothetical protein D6826_00125 [Alphaproteobacteria bacterium]|nr:MAG: hypothetical protein D6826_00125 [Alphaproteobacteria bacterium]
MVRLLDPFVSAASKSIEFALLTLPRPIAMTIMMTANQGAKAAPRVSSLGKFRAKIGHRAGLSCMGAMHAARLPPVAATV